MNNFANYQEATNAIILARNPLDPHSDHQSLAVALTMENLRGEIVTTVECVDPQRIPLFRRAGVDGIVCLASIGSNLIVQEALDPGVHSVLHQITSNTYGQQVYVVDVGQLADPTFGAITRICEARGEMAIGLQKDGEVVINPGADSVVTNGDQVICIAGQRPAAVSS